MNQLKDAIEKAKENENKLILIVGLPDSGKSKLIHEYSKDCLLYTSKIADVDDGVIVSSNQNGKIIHILIRSIYFS